MLYIVDVKTPTLFRHKTLHVVHYVQTPTLFRQKTVHVVHRGCEDTHII